MFFYKLLCGFSLEKYLKLDNVAKGTFKRKDHFSLCKKNFFSQDALKNTPGLQQKLPQFLYFSKREAYFGCRLSAGVEFQRTIRLFFS